MNTPILIPQHQVVADPTEVHGWQADGNDPYFQLKIPAVGAKGAWLRLHVHGSSSDPRDLKIYLNHGHGFTEQTSWIIGHISSTQRSFTAFIYLHPTTTDARLDVGECAGRFTLHLASLHLVPSIVVNLHVGMQIARRLTSKVRPALLRPRAALRRLAQWRSMVGGHPPRVWWHHLRQSCLHQWSSSVQQDRVAYHPEEHDQILARADSMRTELATWIAPPTISLIVPVYNPRPEHLTACLASVRAQIYPHWELCLADDCSTDSRIRPILEQAARDDHRIKVVFRSTNGHICHATNSALDLATGTYVGLLDNDDLLTPHALFEMAKVIVASPEVDYLYSDEDKLDDKTGVRFDPFFKPEWLPDLLLGSMYTCHLSVYRTELIRAVGGFRPGFEGSQDHDLCLRIAERNPVVRHIPHVLYHWRSHAGSTAGAAQAKNYADIAGLKAVRESLARRGEGGQANPIPGFPGRYYTRYPVRGAPLVSILIPTRDGADMLETCLASVFTKTTYRQFEIIVIDNGSVKPETFALFERYAAMHSEQFRVIHHDIPFNFSRLNNLGAAEAKGEFLLMLNNDTEVITPSWLEEMLGWAQRPSIGVVGAMLLFPDNTIQHAGVILGLGGIANHSHKHLHAEAPGHFGRLLAPSPYSAVTAACLLVRRSTWEQVGGLDEKLQVAFNDVDFCCKIHRLGLQGIVPPQARLYHYESKSRGSEDNPIKQARFLQETSHMRQHWSDLLDRDPAYSPNLSMTHEDFRLKETLNISQ
jgi:glycosyltransferase involved in cell wall biosynthesis